MPELRVLDQPPSRLGLTPRDALLETTELVKQVDRVGYRRYWLAAAFDLERPA